MKSRSGVQSLEYPGHSQISLRDPRTRLPRNEVDATSRSGSFNFGSVTILGFKTSPKTYPPPPPKRAV